MIHVARQVFIDGDHIGGLLADVLLRGPFQIVGDLSRIGAKVVAPLVDILCLLPVAYRFDRVRHLPA